MFRFEGKLSVSQQFLLMSFGVLLGGMLTISWWVANRIDNVVIEHGASVTILYMNTFIPPLLQDMQNDPDMDAVHEHVLQHLLTRSPLTGSILSLEVWTPDKTLLYSSSEPSLNGSHPNTTPELDIALGGQVISRVISLNNDHSRAVIQTFAPVYGTDQTEVIAVVESYQDARALRQQVRQAQYQSWLVVGGATILMYLMLSGLVRGANQTINRQQKKLQASVNNLRSLLEENQSLRTRVQTAAVRANEINEQFLHRLGRDLHDGPAQDVSLALLRIGDTCSSDSTQIDTIHHALESALNEIRAIAAGLQLPELETLSLNNVARRAIREFTRKTGADVKFELAETLPDISISKKQIIYRAISEMLNNAYKHAGAEQLQGCLQMRGSNIYLEISDAGKGFDPTNLHLDHDRLGLIGLQQRVMLVNGTIAIQSEPDHGTRIVVILPGGDTIS